MKKKLNKPVIKTSTDREKSLLEDTPAIFEIERDPKNIKWDIWDEVRTFDKKGRDAVNRHYDEVTISAQKHNIDPDLIRAVLYAENARGHKIVLNDIADKIHISDSVMPMNIQIKKWSGIIDKKPNELYNSSENIEA